MGISRDFHELCNNDLLLADKVRSRRKDKGLYERRKLIAKQLKNLNYSRQEIADVMKRSRTMVTRMVNSEE